MRWIKHKIDEMNGINKINGIHEDNCCFVCRNFCTPPSSINTANSISIFSLRMGRLNWIACWRAVGGQAYAELKKSEKNWKFLSFCGSEAWSAEGCSSISILSQPTILSFLFFVEEKIERLWRSRERMERRAAQGRVGCFFSLWVMGGATRQCSAKRRQTTTQPFHHTPSLFFYFSLINK